MYAAIGAGVIAVIAVVGLVLTLTLRDAGPAGGTATSTTSGSSTTTSSPSTSSDSGSASDGDQIALRDAMQKFIDALNTRDVLQIRESVCSQMRPKIVSPPKGQGNVVLETLEGTNITGDTAQSTVTTHVELGGRRTESQTDPENFAREGGTWYVCPGAEPDIGT